MCKKLYRLVNGIYDRNNTPVILGGDHSLSIGSVASSIKKYGDDVFVLWIDAHTDINTPQTSPSKMIHGMPNGVNMGLGAKTLSPCNCKRKLTPNKFVTLGARHIDDGEFDILKKNKILYYNALEVRKKGIENVVDEIKRNTKAKHVHISFDVDCLDPSEFSATGYNIAECFTVAEVIDIINCIQKNYNLALFECVEYNPLKDNFNDINKVAKIISSVKF